MNFIRAPSPNFDERPPSHPITTLIIHYTAMESADQAISWLCNPLSKVSAHYVICEKGKIYQLVEDTFRAWHAGVSSWQGQEALNDRSIGIELAHPGYGPFPPAQIRSLIILATRLVKKHSLSPSLILGHSDVAPQRKQDPGPCFPWKKLSQQGLGLWVSHAHLPPKGTPYNLALLKTTLSTFGYGIPLTHTWDQESNNVMKAFIAHFLPQVYLEESLENPSNAPTIGAYGQVVQTLLERLLKKQAF